MSLWINMDDRDIGYITLLWSSSWTTQGSNIGITNIAIAVQYDITLSN